MIGTISKLKAFAQQNKKPTEWEKIFVNDIPNKGLISKVYKRKSFLTYDSYKTRKMIGKNNTLLLRYTIHNTNLKRINYIMFKNTV